MIKLLKHRSFLAQVGAVLAIEWVLLRTLLLVREHAAVVYAQTGLDLTGCRSLAGADQLLLKRCDQIAYKHSGDIDYPHIFAEMFLNAVMAGAVVSLLFFASRKLMRRNKQH
jgi:hypothetical protein